MRHSWPGSSSLRAASPRTNPQVTAPNLIFEPDKYANNPVESDHSQLKHRLRPMRGLRTDRTATVIIAGHAFMQNLRRGHYELGVEAPARLRVAAAFDELAGAM